MSVLLLTLIVVFVGDSWMRKYKGKEATMPPVKTHPVAACDAGEVEKDCLEMAASCRQGGGDPAQMARLDDARKILLSDSSRLRHLMELEFPGAQVACTVTPEFDFFDRVSRIASAASTIPGRRDAVTSPSEEAVLESEIGDLKQSIEETREKIDSCAAKLGETIRELDARWPNVRPAELAQCATEAGFLENWTATLSEASAKLTPIRRSPAKTRRREG